MKKQALKRTPLDEFQKVRALYDNQIERQFGRKLILSDAQVMEIAFCHVLGYEIEIKRDKKKCKIIKKLI